jgi:hypothetical protein
MGQKIKLIDGMDRKIHDFMAWFPRQEEALSKTVNSQRESIESFMIETSKKVLNL